MITILGLGPGEWHHLTLEAAATLNSHDELWLRTRHHPLVAEMPAHLAVRSFDHFYDEADHFAALYQRIASEVVRLGQRPEGVLYAVPGHPNVGESTVAQIVAQASTLHLPVRLVGGLSFIEPALSAVRADALDGLQIADATTLAGRYHPPFDGDRPVLLGQLYSRLVAADAKLVLMELYPADHPVTLLEAVGTQGERLLTLPLYELDRHSDFSALTTLWIPPLALPGALPHVQNIVAHLRAPDGCPWDQEQDHHSLRAAVLEEAYEVVDAIERDTPGELRDELGDLLLMVLMHSQIAHESGDFSLSDVIAGLAAKLVRRHPHVFGELALRDSAEVLDQWEAIKAQERAARPAAQPDDPFAGVAEALPALVRAQKIVKRLRRAGGAAPDSAAALAAWQQRPDAAALGDLLLALSAEAAQRGIKAEEALRHATTELIARQPR